MERALDEFNTKEADDGPTAPRWTGTPFVALAHQLNEQCVELVCELAAVSSEQEFPKFISQNRDLWRLIEVEARRLVAAFPFVIVDLRFKDAESWQRAATGHLMSPATSPLCNGVTPKLVEDLALETLLFARQAAREDVNVAKAMFAMASPVATLIGSLSLPQVRAIAAGNAPELRVRWDNDPEFWRDLVIACREGDEQSIARLRRQGKLLFCGEIIPMNR
jgi:hypothetical protein